MEATAQQAFTFCGVSPSDNQFCVVKSDVLVGNLLADYQRTAAKKFRQSVWSDGGSPDK